MKTLSELTEREILALAISSEEEDSRIYMTFAEDLAERYPTSAKMFEGMAEEEEGHRHRLLDLYQQRFGSRLPPIRREDVKGFLRRRPIWLTRNLPLDTICKEAQNMEFQAARFYDRAIERTTDAGVRNLLGDLATAERGHETRASQLETGLLTDVARKGGRRDAAADVRPPIRAARPRRSDGRLSLDTCATFRGGLRDPK